MIDNQKYIDFRITYETVDVHEPDDKYTNRIILFEHEKCKAYVQFSGVGMLSFELIKLGEGNFKDCNIAGGSVTIVQSDTPPIDSSGVSNNADSQESDPQGNYRNDAPGTGGNLAL